jgi:P22_AR N-terminal domain
MSGETALVPIDERKVDFYGDEITTALVKAEGQTQIYVPLRPICDYLGLSWSGQRERVNRDPVLSEEVRFVRVSRTARGGNPVVLSLPLEFLNGWLFGIMPSRVKSEIAFKLLCYRRECFNTL